MISVAMATYNGVKYIREQVDSILNQTYQDFELVICDDCSVDSTWELVQNYEKVNSKIRCYQNKENIGYIKNFEQAMSFCAGEYIALSDQDDIWEYNHLELLLQNIGNNLLIGSNALLVNEQNESLNITLKDINHIKNVPDDPFLIFQRLLHMSFIQGASTLFNKKLLIEAFPFPGDIPHDYWLSVIAASKSKLVYLDYITLHYRRHKNTVTTNTIIPNIKEMFHNKNIQIKLLNHIQQRLYLTDERFVFLFEEALLVYKNETLIKRKLRQVLYLYRIYKKVNWNNSTILLLYKMIYYYMQKFI
jgi:glycosyltransferase involved in cell wall biosynthesis